MTDEVKRPAQRPKGTKKEGVRRELLPEEQEDLFRAAHRRGIREEFLLKLTYTLALRVKEAVELRLDDFDEKTKEVLIRGVKEGRHRHYHIPDLWPLYERWLKERKAPASNPWLFPHRDKPNDHLTTGGGQAVFYNAARDAGIKGHSIHDLRHSCGTDMANAGDPQVMIAAWLRHQSFASAERYVSTRLSAEHQAMMTRRRERRWGKR
jgi:integrase